MRQAVNKKLNSSRGTSMILAVLYLLVCLTVGAVVLTAASANAGRLERNRQEQQNYLAVASAAELIKEDLRTAKFTADYKKVETEYWWSEETEEVDEAGNKIWVTHSETVTTYEKGDAPEVSNSQLLEKVEGDLSKLYYAALEKEKPAVTRDWTIESLPDQLAYELAFEAGHEIPAVSGTLSVSKGPALDPVNGAGRYTVTVVLRDEGGGNAMTMVFSAVENKGGGEVTQSGNPTITTYTTAVTWGEPVITKGAEA